MKKNDHLEKGWIRPILPTKIRDEQELSEVTDKELVSFVESYAKKFV